MGKLWKRVCICLTLAALVWCGTVLADRQRLDEGLIRLHVVANSDSGDDQAVKLRVRDAVISCVQADLARVTDVEAAKAYLQENLPKIQSAANAALEAAGVDQEAVVSLCREAFPLRRYDSFTLPAGVYEALRVTIGQGAGHNWWCVAFPNLCLPAVGEDFADTAAGAGFPDSLTAALENGGEATPRFFLLEALGRLQARLFRE